MTAHRWVDQPDHTMWLQSHLAAQLRFARFFPHPDGGAYYLGDGGVPDLARPVHTWITARMLHVYSLGVVPPESWRAPYAAAGVAAAVFS